jgi:hypothetical protein
MAFLPPERGVLGVGDLPMHGEELPEVFHICSKLKARNVPPTLGSTEGNGYAQGTKCCGIVQNSGHNGSEAAR